MMPAQQPMPPQQPMPSPPAGPPQGAPQPQMDEAQLSKLLMAGMRLMYDPKTREYFIAGLKKAGNPVDVMAAEIIGLVKMLDERSKGKIPKQMVVPVAIALLIEAANFAAEAGLLKLDQAGIAATAKKIVLGLLQSYGVLDKVHAMGQKQQPQQEPGQEPVQEQQAGLIAGAQGGV